MNCSKCGTELQAGENYCITCGTAVTGPSVEEQQLPGMTAPSEPQSNAQPQRKRQLSKGVIGLIVIALVALIGGILYYQYGNGADPRTKLEQTLKSYVDAMANNDAEAFLALNRPDEPKSDEQTKDVSQFMELMFGPLDFVEYEFEIKEEDDDQAEVEVTMTFKDDTRKYFFYSTLRLNRMDDEWYIDYHRMRFK